MASLNVDTGIPGYLRTIRKGTQDHPRLSASRGRKTSGPPGWCIVSEHRWILGHRCWVEFPRPKQQDARENVSSWWAGQIKPKTTSQNTFPPRRTHKQRYATSLESNKDTGPVAEGERVGCEGTLPTAILNDLAAALSSRPMIRRDEGHILGHQHASRRVMTENQRMGEHQ